MVDNIKIRLFVGVEYLKCIYTADTVSYTHLCYVPKTITVGLFCGRKYMKMQKYKQTSIESNNLRTSVHKHKTRAKLFFI